MDDQGHAAPFSWSEVEQRIDDHVRGLDDEELDDLVQRLAREHHVLCLRRWVLFDRVDVLTVERRRRLREALARLGPDGFVRDTVARGPRSAGRRRSDAAHVTPPVGDAEAPLRPLPPVGGLSDDELADLLAQEGAAVNDVSARRQHVWLWLRILLAEQDRRHG